MADLLRMPAPEGSWRFMVDIYRRVDGSASARIVSAAQAVFEEDPQEPHLKVAKLADELVAAAAGLREFAATLDPEFKPEEPAHG